MSPLGPRALHIGLTGGIASGKSTVAAMFADQGVPILDADLIAREVLVPGSALLAQLFDRFGPGVRGPDGTLDRAALRRVVFAEPALRRELEALLHPAIRARTEQLAARLDGPYQLHVVPLLVETNAAARYDRVLVIDCPESLQWQRLRARPGLSEQEARAMIEAQASRAARLAAADDILLNDGDLAALRPQVAALHARYLELSAVRKPL
ncbi:MAG TPA: dephospho-CoA kinase [Steroidobacteraceae bacterium]|nr:dephospho-CoA kinase [Steroidobacteraceae bacterium]